MATITQYSPTALQTVFSDIKYTVTFVRLVPIIALALFLIPAVLIPGNDIAFQAALFQIADYILLTIVAILESLVLVMTMYLFQRSLSQKHSIGSLGRGGLGIISGVPAFVFGTASCPMCVAAILGFFGCKRGLVCR